ncbi:hypothetical protein ENSA5_38230 [Enhygromyxa salina]|uniref:Uncharacterized protein n=2 Tax=Enhygromyxa salina TaxID=215803 RepID=A0A2S9XS18_9BACT|nr:hypothetical protein ENSA5_38230 [Enhygromyxa salina]
MISFTVAGSLICTPLMIPASAQAGTLPAVAPAQDPEEPALTEAKKLYKEGEIQFQTAEYEEALVLWKRAFGMLPEGDETRGIRHALVYNIAEAHRRAYEVSRNPTHLRKAKILLDNYRADHRALYGDEPEAVKERSEVDDRIAELDKIIAESEAAGETATPIADGGGGAGTVTPPPDGSQPPQPHPQPEPQPAPKPLTPQQQWEAEVKADPTLGPMWVQSNKRIVGGAVLSGIGIPFTLVSILLFISAPSAVVFPGAVWAGGVATGVIGLGLLIPGGMLLGKGIAQRKEVTTAKPKPIGRVIPVMLPSGGGVGYTLRF